MSYEINCNGRRLVERCKDSGGACFNRRHNPTWFRLPLFSQAAVGTILGGVFDSTGGAIAGAKVTITDVARGTTRELTTDDTGEYTAPSLLAGTYTVRAEAKGFQTVERTNVLLEVAQSVRVDLKLSPGAADPDRHGHRGSPAINTTDATLGGTVTNQSVASLPLVTRNFLQLLQLRPGVVDVPGGNGTATTTNGRREGADVMLVEGVTQFDLATTNVLINGAQKGGAVDELPLDSVQEFSTQQNPPAEYGWRDGSAVNLAVKSGTNSIHGSAYAFGRDAAATDAKQFSAVPGPESVGNTDRGAARLHAGWPHHQGQALLVRLRRIYPSVQFQHGLDQRCQRMLPGGCQLSMVDACNAAVSDASVAVNPLSAQISGIANYGQAGAAGTLCMPQPATSTFENLFPYNPTTSAPYFPQPCHHLTEQQRAGKSGLQPQRAPPFRRLRLHIERDDR